MSTRDIIRADFEEFIRLDPSVPDGLRTALKLKERVPSFVDNIAREIETAELAGITLDRMKIKGIVYSLTGLFVHLMKTQVDEMEMSAAARTLARQSIEGDDISNKLDDHGNADLTEELGIIITDKK